MVPDPSIFRSARDFAETGLSLFGVLKQADPALVDPGVTAQLECLLDEVVIGKQEMVGAIDAVCDVAQRIIGKLKEGASAVGPAVLGAAANCDARGRPPTPAMKRFAESVARQKRIKPPPGYTKSESICRVFLDQHAPKKADGETSGEIGSKPASPAQMLFAEKIAREKGIAIPDETKANSAAMSAWIKSNLSGGRGKGVATPPTSRRDQRRLNRRRQRGRGNAQLMLPAVQQLLLDRIREPVASHGIPIGVFAINRVARISGLLRRSSGCSRTTASLTALARRNGHLVIAFCRCMNILGRYCAG
jgi:hypothetical protein